MTVHVSRLLRHPALVCALALLVIQGFASHEVRASETNGVVKLESAYGFEQTVARLRSDIEQKGIMFFAEINQGDLGRKAGIEVEPSVLLLFGNPPLGVQFLSANPDSGLDWPVRVLVTQDSDGHVWIAYTDFNWIAGRYGIHNRKAQFDMANEVITSIASSVVKK